MAITVQLYTFAKKINSTARPSSAPAAFDCVLKEGCSIIYPAIGIDNGAAWNPSAYNYAHIAAFDRYYYVSDWSYSGGLWWASLTVDALATWRSTIYNTTEYVLRAASAYDGAIIDTMFPAKSTYNYSISRWDGAGSGPYTPWTNNLNNGFYVAGIINNDNNSIGAVSYYAFTPSQFANFKNYLMGSVDWTGILATNPDIGENLFKALFDPFQYITSVYWFPFSFPSGYGTSIASIKVGWWEIQNVSCYRLNSYYYSMSSTININQHPLAPTRGAYLNSSPYTEYYLYAPPFGEFILDGSFFPSAVYTGGATGVTCTIVIDLITGMGALSVSLDTSPSDARLLYNQSQIAIPIQIAQIYNETNQGDTINTIAEAAVAAAKRMLGASEGNRITDMGVMDAISLGSVHMSQAGSNGSLCQFSAAFFIGCKYYNITDNAYTDKGRPLCQERQLSTLAPGYVITAGSHVALAGTDYEIGAVNDALDGGVFLA